MVGPEKGSKLRDFWLFSSMKEERWSSAGYRGLWKRENKKIFLRTFQKLKDVSFLFKIC